MLPGVHLWLGVAAGGVVAGQLLPASVGFTWAIGLGALVAGGLAVAFRRGAWPRGAARVRLVACLAVVAVCLGGVAAGRARLEAASGYSPPPAHVARLELPRRAAIVGTVYDLPRTRGGRGTVLLDAVRVDGAPAQGRIRLTLRGTIAKLRPGDELTLEATLRRPRGFANPGSFDFAGYLARRGILVTASAHDAPAPRRRSRPVRSLNLRIARLRHRLVRAIARAAPRETQGVLAALVVGHQDGVPTDLREAFARVGVVHVLSVSGLHVTVVGTVTFVALGWLLGRSTQLVRRLDLRAVAAVGALGPVFGYTALAGFEVPTVRSMLMAGSTAAALVLGRRAQPWRTVAIAAVALALAAPGVVRDVGFQLSFASVLSILLVVGDPATGGGTPRRKRLRLVARVSLAAAAGTAPLTAFHFQQVSLIGPLANPIVIPWFGAVVVVVGLAAAAVEPWWPPIGGWGFRLAGEILRPGVALVEALAEVPGAAVRVPTPTPAELVALSGILLGPLTLSGRTRRLVVGLAALALVVDAFWWSYERFGASRLRVTLLDVGQGDAAVVELPGGGVLVVDGGGFPGSDFDTGAAVVLPFLAARKILRVDAVVMTHAHPDHFDGLRSVLPLARELWWSGRAGRGSQWTRFAAAVREGGVAERLVRTGLPLPPFARGVRVLHPPGGWDAGGVNDASVVLALRHGRTMLLLTGDIEAAGEATLVRSAADLRATALKVPHHGSRTSSSASFLGRVAPQVAVISVGADNRYGLPAAEVEARYRARGTCLLRTDRCGAIVLESDGERLRVSSHLGCACPA